jgi:hypothetical protein
MLMANAQFNIVHSPLVAATQSVVHEQDRVETNTRAQELAERAVKAQEQVREVQPAENEAIQDEETNVPDALFQGGRRRRRRRPPAQSGPDAAYPPDSDDENPPPADPLHHIDITV